MVSALGEALAAMIAERRVTLPEASRADTAGLTATVSRKLFTLNVESTVLSSRTSSRGRKRDSGFRRSGWRVRPARLRLQADFRLRSQEVNPIVRLLRRWVCETRPMPPA